MEKPTVKITVIVEGPCNSGKSTIAYLISEELLKQGFKVKFVDEPKLSGWHNFQSERIARLNDKGTELLVQTVQMNRE
jgi:thymidylate kinase